MPGKPFSLATRLPLLLGLAALLAAALPAAAVPPPLTLEPGLPVGTGDQLLPLSCVDASGAPVRPRAEDLQLTVSGAPRADFRLRPFAPAGGGAPSAVAVLLAPAELDPRERDAWLQALADFSRDGSDDAARGVFLAGDRLQTVQAPGVAPPAAGELDRLWRADAPARLWDCVLAALTELAGADLPDRRVLVVVSSGLEDLESEHPVATCRDAAAAARIAVYALVVPAGDAAAAGAGRARLSQLVRDTGRLRIWDGPDRAYALRGLFSVVDGVQGLEFRAPDLPLPAAVRLQWGGAAADGELRGRVALARRGPGPLWLLALILILLILALATLARLRLRSLGELVPAAAAGTAGMSVPPQGATIGSAADNTIVLSDRRVSRRHAVLKRRGREMLLTDLRSTNGTQVNGRPIRTATIRDGDRILLGGAVELIYRRGARRR